MSTDARTWEDQTLYDDNGDKVGTIDAVYLDRETDEPEWATVNTGLFGLRSSFVPLHDARPGDDGIVTTHSKDRIKDAPNVDADEHLSEREEAQLYKHYGIDYRPYEQRQSETSTDRRTTDNAASAGHDREDHDHTDVDRGSSGHDETLTRSEEEVRVGTTEREAGRVRLRKYVETDTVTEQVPIKREKVRVEREPVEDADAEGVEGDLVEDDVEVVVREEEPVVDKRAVAKERVRLETDVEQDEVEVSEQVRREQFDLEGEGEHADTRLPD